MLVLLYDCEARTILEEDDRRLEAFHARHEMVKLHNRLQYAYHRILVYL